jgi:hypothetical protein
VNPNKPRISVQLACVQQGIERQKSWLLPHTVVLQFNFC